MDDKSKYLLVVGGPTASGKTGLAIALAQHFDTIVLSADSRQFYKEMRIGNARPDEDELSAVPHLFIADRPLSQPLSAGAFAREAKDKLTEIFKTNDIAVLAGGSGLFIRALTEGLDEFPDIPTTVREEVDGWYTEKGLPFLLDKLKELDTVYYETVDRYNPARIRRALEVCLAGGKPFSSFLDQAKQKQSFTAIYLQPSWPREALYDRINRRVEMMIEEGLETEARDLYSLRDCVALQTVGYQEWFEYFNGVISKERAVALIKQNSRRYAKRQLTWNRRDGYWKQVAKGDVKLALKYIQLVIDEGIQLISLPTGDVGVKHVKRQRTGLQTANGDLVYLEVVIGKREAFVEVQSNENEAFSDTAKDLLLNECIKRAGVACVYATEGIVLSKKVLQNNGFVKVVEDVPSKLIKAKGKDLMVWRNKD